VQSAILIRSPYSRGATTTAAAAAAAAAITKARTGRRRCQQRQLQGVRIGNGSRGNNTGRMLALHYFIVRPTLTRELANLVCRT